MVQTLIKLTYGVMSQDSVYLWSKERGGELKGKKQQGIFGVLIMFYSLTWLVVTWIFSSVKVVVLYPLICVFSVCVQYFVQRF